MRIAVSLIILLMAISTMGQDTLNRVDSAGRKQGFWIKTNDRGQKIYEGTFIDDVPAGKFIYYYPGGQLKIISVISDSGRVARTVSYFTNGKSMAEGKYVDQKKDSVWLFYNETDGTLVSEECYHLGKKDGSEKVFFSGKGVAELITWKGGVKEGLWEQYFDDGTRKLKGSYRNDQRDGLFESWYITGKPMMSGSYVDGLPEGIWIYYEPDTDSVTTVEYRQGIPVKEE